MLKKMGTALWFGALLGMALVGYYRWWRSNRGDYNSRTMFVILVAPIALLLAVALFEGILDWFGINF